MQEQTAKSYLSRKFILTLLAIGTAFYLAVTGKSLSEYTGALAVILGFYQGANVAHYYIEKKYTEKGG